MRIRKNKNRLTPRRWLGLGLALIMLMSIVGCGVQPVVRADCMSWESSAPEATAQDAAVPETVKAETATPVLLAATSRNTTKTARYETHLAFMTGQGRFFHPDRTLTRAETAVLMERQFPEEMAARLAERKQADREAGRSGPYYTDVVKDSWYEDAVLEAYGVMRGYQNRFRPGDPITLEEYAIVLLRVCGIQREQVNGKTVPALTQAAGLGWVDGRYYTDGTMLMNRALAAAMTNRAAGRTADADYLKGRGVYFLDVTEKTPYYYDILEAAIDHVCEAKDDSEVWDAETVTKVPLAPGMEYHNGMAYYIQSDGTLLTKPGLQTTTVGTVLVADESGRIYADGQSHLSEEGMVFCSETGAVVKGQSSYSSGDSELDGYLRSILDGCTTEKMTQTERLRAAFDYVRGFSYLGRNATLDDSVKTMPESNAIEYAKKIFATGKGDCYNFAAAFYYLAKALGYNAKAIVGDCLYSWNTRAIAHGWVEIEQNGQWYLYDPEIENYNIRQGISNTAHGAFGVTYATAPGTYYPH